MGTKLSSAPRVGDKWLIKFNVEYQTSILEARVLEFSPKGKYVKISYFDSDTGDVIEKWYETKDILWLERLK